MSTYTESLGLELITPGSQAGLWGNTTNNSLNLIDQAVTGVTPISFASASGTTRVLTDYNGAEDEARAAVINITGTATGSNTIVVPNKQKTYLVRNDTSQDVVFQTAVPSATYTVGAGYSILIFCDGNNNVFTGIASPGVGTLPVNAGGTGSTTFTAGFVKSTGGTNALTSSSAVALASEVTGTLPVANGGTGVTSFTSGAVLLGNGTGNIATATGSIVGQVLTWNGSNWAAATPSSGGVTSISGTSPIVVTGTTTPTISLSTVPVILGGTGATDAATARTNIGAYAASNPSGYINSSPSALTVTGGTPVYMGSAAPGGGGIQCNSYNFAPTTSFYLSGSVYLAINALSYYQFNGAGTATAPAWVSTSDGRIKENVNTVQSALNNIATLRPVEYSMKVDNLPSANRYGFIAQELEQVYPNLVDTSGLTIGDVENVKAVHYNDMIPLLVKAIQELKAEVDALKTAK